MNNQLYHGLRKRRKPLHASTYTRYLKLYKFLRPINS